MSHLEKIRAYRHLYRELLRAVQFAAPYKYVVRDQLRAAFREKGACWDQEEYKRTLWFLQAAAREAGLEHKILKNLIHVAHQRQKTEPWKIRSRKVEETKEPDLHKAGQEITSAAFDHYDMTIAMLNKTMGIRLR
ncbi:Mitochondrial carrier protein [Colletotrichum higginsianum IMI 349063]|uniref:Mitochondrial carrier protein n=2 Tax=Colletotrichum higginsianum TaxID=80884 RepID=A0A1B7XV66_COLHI|nr:Mitochondrial carrier protein [Colletotrichum higginsianum IMI 349063]OBR03646.1 Mitochondrial carrier protein [Colletotrichum higginsianum IMI 349063]TIC97204.1 UPF0593 mitochondrial protein [Colletotrichum higginsianum]GJD02005.1 mitochondrial carrier protein [Colletotrichum higginsianum]